MTRLFTILTLLFATTYLFAQQPSFKGQLKTSEFEASEELNHSFKKFDVYQLDVTAFDEYVKNAGESIPVNLEFGDDYNWDISLEPRDIRKPGHLRRWTTDSGVKMMPPSENLTFRGKVKASKGGSVSFTIDDELLRGFIKNDGKMYYIEPVWYFIKGADKDLFVVYDVDNVQPHPDVKCGATELHKKTDEILNQHGHDHDHDHGAEKAMACKEVEIAIASDWLMFDHFGSAGAVEGFETGVMFDVQTNYDDEFADMLLFSIVEFFTVTAQGDDPWTTSTNAGTLLNSFTSWGPTGFGADHDVACLWTDRNLNGGTIGIAWLSSVCTNNKYHVCQNFSSNANLLRVLWAHELGHNFSLTHDPSGNGTIMAPSVNNTNDWSSTSIAQMNSFVPTRTCLTSCFGASPPVAVFDADPTEGCAPMTVQFTDQSQFFPTSWEWEFPGGTPNTSTDQNPLVTYSTPGIYDVTLTVENATGSDQLTIPGFIVVNDIPSTSYTFDQVGLTVIFTNTSLGATSYLWDFGDYNTSTDVDPVHTYSVDGFYDVTLTGFNDCGEESFTINIPVFVAPTSDFSADPTQGCAPLVVNFTSNASPNTTNWNWEFPGGAPSSSSDENPTVEYAAPGVYDVKLTAINPAGTDEEEKTAFITVGTTPVANFTFTTNGNTVTFDNTSTNNNGIGAMTFAWDFGDGNTSTDEDPTHTYTTNGTYDVELEVTNDCGAIAITQQVTILLPPVAAFSAPVTEGCAPFAVTFENLSTGNPSSYAWEFPGGDPANSTDEEPTVTYNAPGSYDVTLIAINTAGSDTTTLTDYITVNPNAVAGFTSTTTARTVAFTNVSTNATSYFWDFGDGNNSTDVDPTHTYADDGTYTVVLSATNDCGTVTMTETIVIVTAPTAGFSSNVTSGCDPLTVMFMNQSSSNATSFQWSFPGGNPSSSTEENPTVTYNDPGTYTVTLTVSNTAGSNTATQTNYITVNTTPFAGFTSTVNNNTASFTNTSTNGTSYEWNFGDGNSSTDANPTHTYADDGTYTVTLSATNDCGTVMTTETVVIVTAPTAGFSSNVTSGCDPLTVSFMNQSSNNATSWEWDFPGGNPSSSTDENPTVTYNDPGTYTVTLTATNAAGSNTATQTNYITVNTVPATGYNFMTNANTTTFTNTTTNGTSYSWDFGDGNSSTDSNPVHEYAGDGTYEVVLSATNDCGTTTSTQTVVISSLPQAGFTSNVTSGCDPLTVEFMDLSSANTTSWEWEFTGGNPSTSTGQNPTVTYDAPGTYSVTLTAINAVGENTVTQTNYITVNTTPTPNFSNTTNMLQVDFTNSSTGATSYSWDFGDGNSSTDSAPQHTYADDGTYEVVLSATNDCGTVTSTQTVTVVSAPSAGFMANVTNGCAPVTVEFTSQASANTTDWNWDFPGGNPATSTDENPTVTYDAAGSYTVTLTVSNSAGQDEVIEMNYITVGDVPAASFTSDVDVFNVDFTNTSTNPVNSGGLTFEWDFGDGDSSTDESPTHTYASDGTYEVTFVVTNDCGSKTINGQVNIVTLPTAGFSADQTSGCAPMEVQFTNESSQNAESYSWEFPGGFPSTSIEESPIVVYNMPGVYDVILTVTNGAGMNVSTETSYITVNAAPLTSFGFNVSGQDVTFDNTSDNFTTMEWDFGDGNTSDEDSPTHTYGADGVYTVVLSTTNECGTTTSTQLIVIATEGPVAAFEAMTTEGCLPFVVEFQNLSSQNAETFEWTFEGGDPATSDEENPTVTYNSAGVFDVTLVATNMNGSNTFMEMDYIIVNDVPTPGFSADNNWETVTFTNNSDNATSYSWDFGDGNSSTDEDPVHTYDMAGEYEVTMTATNDCGFNTITQTIVVMANSITEIPGISEFNVWPNPNNGRFSMTLRGEAMGDLQVSFTNVLGQVILNDKIDFRSGNVTKEFAFNELAAGVYIFQVRSGNKALYKKVVVD